jgi:hypothetical protein
MQFDWTIPLTLTDEQSELNPSSSFSTRENTQTNPGSHYLLCCETHVIAVVLLLDNFLLKTVLLYWCFATKCREVMLFIISFYGITQHTTKVINEVRLDGYWEKRRIAS